jgi:ABC-type amino acid transport substrate-binding protein/HPt (histidine-containing phosphotransfer) domain-containing protein
VNPTRVLPLLLTLLCWLPALLAAAPQPVELTQAERDWLAANPRILLGSDAEWRPFVWQAGDGSQAGIESDLIARINALTGADIQLVLGKWGDMVERARRGELHGLAASASHAERADRFLFSASPYSTHKFIFTRQGSSIASMDDLSGRRVGVLRRNLSDLKLLDAWPAIVRAELDSPLELAVALQNAELDAVISSANLHWIATENLLPDVRLAFPVPGSRIDLRYSIGKEHAPLIGIMDKAIAAIEPREIQAILEKWGEPAMQEIAISAEERAWLAQRHRVRVRIGEAPPWEINGPEPQGMAVDYLRIIGERLGIDFQFVPAEDSWIEGFDDMAGAQRKYDLLPAAKRTQARLAALAMSGDYLSSPWMIFTRKDTRDIDNLNDLRGRTVAVERGYVMHGLLRTEAPAIDLSVQDSTRDALLAVSTGKADAYVGNLIVTDYLMQAYGIVNLTMAGPTPFGNHTQAMATRKEWAPLISLIDKGLASIPAKQHIAIRQHWLGSVADAEQQAPLDLDDEERAWLADHPTIRVGAYPLAPYIREQGGQVDGYLVEVLQAVAARAGLRTDLQFESLAQVLEGIRQGSLDATMAVSPTPERSRELFLSKGTTAFTLSIFARKEARDIHGVESLAGKTLATYQGYSWNARYPELLPDTRVLIADDREAMFRMVAEGRADAAISETASGKVLLRRYLLTGVEPKAVAVFDGRRSLTGHYWGVSRRLPLLASILDKAHAALPEADKQRIWERWFARGSAAGEVDLVPAERAYLAGQVFHRALATAWMPFDFADDGAPTGVAEDYWRLIRDKLGLQETTGQRQPFGEILAGLEQGETDLYVATTRTADRARYALFSDPYERYPIAIAGKAGAGLFAGTDSLEGRRVAVGRDYSAHHLLRAHSPGIDFVLVDDTRAALQAVAAGSADAAVDILPVLHQQIEGFPAGRVKLVGVTDVQFPLEIMVRREHAALIPLLNRAIAAITPEERAAIHNKWLLRDVVTAPDYTWLWQVLMTALLILATILVWNDRLRREVWRRKQVETALLRAKEIADSANRAKGDFLANMSHEIRTPLNAVIGLTRLSLETEPAPALRDYLRKIDLSARTLLALISDILDLSRIEAGKLQPRREPLALTDVLDRVRVMVEQPAAEKGLTLRIDGPAEPVGRLLGDELRLTQVLLNLVGNAVKFTVRGRVSLAVWVEDENARELRLAFTVTDTGIGIPEERRADLFDAFTQVDTSGTRGHGGSGLGLAISARLVALMGGRLEVESVEGKGSCFWFSLAFPRALEQAAEEAMPIPAALRGVRVLVAEDDPVSQLLARDLLGRRGAVVAIAGTGAEAVAAVAQGDFDIVLMDVRMPEMDGLTACRKIRALPGGGLPIIALTANALAGERERCLAAGMDGYLTKPLEPEALDAELSRWLRSPADVIDAPALAPATVAAAPALPGFDAAKVQRWLDQAPDGWRSMARIFVAEYSEAATAIGAALDAGDRPRAHDLLHRLRGAAGALGAEELAAAAGRMEQSLASDGPIDADLRVRFFASAEAAQAALAGLKPPAPE